MRALRSCSVGDRLRNCVVGQPGAEARCHTASTGDAGFTLAEVLIAMVIFTVAALAATSGIIAAMHTESRTESRVVAANLARDEIEKVRSAAKSAAVSTLPSVTYPPVARNGEAFVVTRTLGSPACTGGLRSVTVQVSWPRSSTPVRSDTVLAC
ncbi:MAG: prepilin-type N-terminal cleavage/methylation protein [Pseudonocardiales bacterium]|nr:prepilin-type N-terminal cleavage/methylation protein [Pseudonocardiales bacterium]